MWRKPGIRIDCPLGCEQRWWRDEYQIGSVISAVSTPGWAA
jgi:hypothetical protein